MPDLVLGPEWIVDAHKEWPWAERLADALGAGEVRVRSVPRGER